MRILMTASWFPSRKHATLGNFVQRHVEAIALLHEVVVLVWFRVKDVSDVQVEKSIEQGVTIYRVYSNHKSWQIWKTNAAFNRGLAAIRQDGLDNFDLIHHHVIYPIGLQASKLARDLKIPMVVTEHWTIYNKKRRSNQPMWLRLISKRVVASAQCICPVSQDLHKTMVEYGLKGHYQVIPNVVDTNIFHISTPEDGFHFLHVSSLEQAHKNIRGILKAWLSVYQKMPAAKLHIGGDGPYAEWAKEANQMGIPEHSIHFFGECSTVEVAERMAKSHCLVLFSRFENLPVVIVEALASGLPVISSHVGGIAEHITKEHGMLVQSENEGELGAAMIAMQAMWNTYNRFDLRRYAEAHFSLMSVANQYNQVYQDVLGLH